MKIISGLILLLFISCGTETGNPLVQDATLTVDEDARVTTAYTVIENVCNKLKDCYNVAYVTCVNKSVLEDNFDSALGLNTGDYSNYNDILNAEVNNSLSVNDSAAASQCANDIKNLSCSDTEVVDAYDTNNQSDYSNVYKLIPVGAGSCQDIY